MENFSELSLSALLKKNLERHGFTQMTPIQEQAIEPALAGQDLVATAQTGSGKTLAFVLPMIQLLGEENAGRRNSRGNPDPTRELAIQISEIFAKMAAGSGVRAAVVVGGLGQGPQLQAIRKGAQVVIATAGRLHDYLGRRLVNLSGVRMLVLDEADRMLDMGFLPTIEKIIAAMPAGRQTFFFSATIESSVKHLVARHVPNGVRIEVGSATKPVETVRLQVYEVEQDHKLGLLETMLRREEGHSWCSPARSTAPIASPRNWPDQGVEERCDSRRPQPESAQPGPARFPGRAVPRPGCDRHSRPRHSVDGPHEADYHLPQYPRISSIGSGGPDAPASWDSAYLRHPVRTRGDCSHRAHSGHPDDPLPIAGNRERAKARRARHPYRPSQAGTAALANVQALSTSRRTASPAGGELGFQN